MKASAAYITLSLVVLFSGCTATHRNDQREPVVRNLGEQQPDPNSKPPPKPLSVEEIEAIAQRLGHVDIGERVRATDQLRSQLD